MSDMSAAEVMKHIESLPDPMCDRPPPPVMASAKDRVAAAQDRRFKTSLLNTKKDTESIVKYILESKIFGGKFRKDGDWVTIANGRSVYQKKVADLVGSIPLRGGEYSAFAYVEIKGVSPGNPFPFSRLDRRNNPTQPSQHEKMTAEYDRKRVVWLAIGWWDRLAGCEPVPVEQGSRTLHKWRKDDVKLTVSLVRWSEWLKIYNTHNYRSIRQKDRHLLNHCRIYKEGGRWKLCSDHWWINFV